MRIVYMGTPDFAVPTLESLIKGGHQVIAAVTQPDKPKGRGKEMQISAKTSRGPIKEIRVYADRKVISRIKTGGEDGTISIKVPLTNLGDASKFIRVEIEGDVKHRMCCTTPFYFK